MEIRGEGIDVPLEVLDDDYPRVIASVPRMGNFFLFNELNDYLMINGKLWCKPSSWKMPAVALMTCLGVVAVALYLMTSHATLPVLPQQPDLEIVSSLGDVTEGFANPAEGDGFLYQTGDFKTPSFVSGGEKDVLTQSHNTENTINHARHEQTAAYPDWNNFSYKQDMPITSFPQTASFSLPSTPLSSTPFLGAVVPSLPVDVPSQYPPVERNETIRNDAVQVAYLNSVSSPSYPFHSSYGVPANSGPANSAPTQGTIYPPPQVQSPSAVFPATVSPAVVTPVGQSGGFLGYSIDTKSPTNYSLSEQGYETLKSRR